MTGYPDRRSVTDEALSAYVDGALSQDEAARVARAAATIPDIAKRIAVLHQLKASVAGMADDVVLINLPRTVAPAPLKNAATLGLAATAVAGFVTISAFWFINEHFGPETFATGETFLGAHNAPLSDLIVSHDAWIATGDSELGTGPNTDWLQDVMQATGLAMVHHAILPGSAGTPGQHFAFVGPNGCRLSLFEVVLHDALTGGLGISINDGLLAASWTEADRGFALVARNMNHGRFMTIAEALHDASRHRGPVGEPALARLHQARQPCLG
ncbi:MAG: hypothetical protein ACK4GC_06265 [Paracoccaceae bacterium]